MTRRALLLSFSLLSFAAVRPVRAQEPLPEADIRNLRADVTRDAVTVSYRVEGAFTPAVRERLAAAAPIRFVHRIRLVHRRAFSTRVLTERVLVMTAQYDNLTRQYSLTRTVDEVAVAATTTESEEEMRRFMTVVDDLKLPRTPAWAGQRKAQLQVRAEYEDTWLLFLLPWTYAARAERDVSLLP